MAGNANTGLAGRLRHLLVQQSPSQMHIHEMASPALCVPGYDTDQCLRAAQWYVANEGCYMGFTC